MVFHSNLLGSQVTWFYNKVFKSHKLLFFGTISELYFSVGVTTVHTTKPLSLWSYFPQNSLLIPSSLPLSPCVCVCVCANMILLCQNFCENEEPSKHSIEKLAVVARWWFLHLMSWDFNPLFHTPPWCFYLCSESCSTAYSSRNLNQWWTPIFFIMVSQCK